MASRHCPCCQRHTARWSRRQHRSLRPSRCLLPTTDCQWYALMRSVLAGRVVRACDSRNSRMNFFSRITLLKGYFQPWSLRAALTSLGPFAAQLALPGASFRKGPEKRPPVAPRSPQPTCALPSSRPPGQKKSPVRGRIARSQLSKTEPKEEAVCYLARYAWGAE